MFKNSISGLIKIDDRAITCHRRTSFFPCLENNIVFEHRRFPRKPYDTIDVENVAASIDRSNDHQNVSSISSDLSSAQRNFHTVISVSLCIVFNIVKNVNIFYNYYFLCPVYAKLGFIVPGYG